MIIMCMPSYNYLTFSYTQLLDWFRTHIIFSSSFTTCTKLIVSSIMCMHDQCQVHVTEQLILLTCNGGYLSFFLVHVEKYMGTFINMKFFLHNTITFWTNLDSVCKLVKNTSGTKRVTTTHLHRFKPLSFTNTTHHIFISDRICRAIGIEQVSLVVCFHHPKLGGEDSTDKVEW